MVLDRWKYLYVHFPFISEISSEKHGVQVVLTLDKLPSDIALGRRDMRCYIQHETAINKGDKIIGDVVQLFVYGMKRGR